MQANQGRKAVGLLGVLTLFSVALTTPSFATGDIEPKTPLEKRGPGNMDVPLEKSPKKAVPTPSPLPKPKAPEKP